MRIGSALLIAWRSIAGRKQAGTSPRGRRYLRGAVLGVALSLVPLVVVLVVADGMIEGITARYLELGTYHLQASPFTMSGVMSIDSQAAALRALPGVVAVYPERQGPAVAISGSRTAGAAIRAIDPAFLRDPGTLSYLRLSSGSLDLQAGNSILLGEALARTLAVHVGESVTIVTARQSFSESGEGPSLAPKISIFTVKGIVSAGYRELDALWAFVGSKAAARILSPDGSRSFIGVKVREPFSDLEPVRARIRASLPPEWTVETWSEVERNLFKSFATTRALLLLVMALTVAVAAINVSSALIMLVLERRRDIAILKSTGAGEGFIWTAFVLAGLATGGAGTVLGLAAGCLVAWRVNDLIAVTELILNG
ncbi:MAG TPA: ABC transporter permease, partial [Rectinemataceae bacterium]|nr:ABC transporter permease [Rectinemataceae bacterium]